MLALPSNISSIFFFILRNVFYIEKKMDSIRQQVIVSTLNAHRDKFDLHRLCNAAPNYYAHTRPL